MSFQTTIARLREAAAPCVQGEASDTCHVRREDVRIALHVIDRLDGELRQAGILSQPDPAPIVSPKPELLAAVARLTKLARETRAIYGQETSAGGEPAYPSWTDDVFALVAAPQASADLMLAEARHAVAAVRSDDTDWDTSYWNRAVESCLFALDKVKSAAAPQDSEAVPLSQYGYQALFNAIGKAVKAVGTDKHPHIEISVEAFRAALSAQPGAQRTGGSE